MGQYANELYSRNCSLEYENKALREKIAEYESGQRYLKLQADFNSVRAGYVRRIKELEKELAEAHITKNRVRDIWFTQCDTDWEQYKKELEKKENRIQELEDKYWKLLRENDQKILDIKADYEKQLSDKDEELRKKDAILQHGWKEYEADKERMQKYGAPFEQALLNRIEKYRDNYFAWLEDFTLPTTNNLSERSLRGAKSKMKIAGQFGSEESPEFYAIIRTYTETCRRHGVNEFDALVRLCEGRPYTIAELFP